MLLVCPRKPGEEPDEDGRTKRRQKRALSKDWPIFENTTVFKETASAKLKVWVKLVQYHTGIAASLGSGRALKGGDEALIIPLQMSAQILPAFRDLYSKVQSTALLEVRGENMTSSENHRKRRGGNRGLLTNDLYPLFPYTATNLTNALAGSDLQSLGSVGKPSSVPNPSGLHSQGHRNSAFTLQPHPEIPSTPTT